MNRLRVSQFDYDLPDSYIAQHPAPLREGSRLMVYHLNSGEVEHRRFSDIGEYLPPGSVLVLNDTRVIPARLIGNKQSTGGRVEVFLLRERRPDEWECLLKPAARLREGTLILFHDSAMTARVKERTGSGTGVVLFEGAADPRGEVERIGRVPLPPYIRRTHSTADLSRGDRERYQTVYAARPGAVAAPTAGLHFSEELLAALRTGGVQTAMLTLHVGLGTFRPLQGEDVEGETLHEEYFELGEEAAALINRARGEGRRVVAVGTTVARVLESAADAGGMVRAARGWTDIFIHPPYRFKILRNLVTNFHLPRSSLLMLVAALAGRGKVLELYTIAVHEGYRFYSYGDAMLLLES
ncbi:MAG: tRNA preQ1(34) S-adenosylmethionine ribosyltransferase-isomerase QueA [Candidatus Aureabacteria bacterium]|nr:tRNA preQ1(34) S-adenosylmethionine ribosyltransferase-isomerase QueA [Candidatus Auribacterota bacterium]